MKLSLKFRKTLVYILTVVLFSISLLLILGEPQDAYSIILFIAVKALGIGLFAVSLTLFKVLYDEDD